MRIFFGRSWLWALVIGLIGLGMIGRAPAEEYYVALSGNHSSGTNWTTAFTNLQRAITVAGPGAEIRVKADTFRIGTPIDLSGKVNVHIRGGYAGAIMEPDRLAARFSRFTPQTGCSIRLFYGNALTADLERIWIDGGYLTNATGSVGAGLLVTGDSALTLRDCTFSNNQGFAWGDQAGGALYVTGGVLVVENCRFIQNALNKANWDTRSLGGGAGVANAVSSWSNVSFSANSVWTRHYAAYGGALWLSGGRAELADCVFDGNYTFSEGNIDNPSPTAGGALYAEEVRTLTIDDTRFVSNRLVTSADTGTRRGGVLYLGGSSSRTLLRRCVVVDNGDGGEEKGDLYLDAGFLALTNVLVVRSAGGSGLYVNGGSVDATHVTLAGNCGFGLQGMELNPTSAPAGAGDIPIRVRNAIVWDNAAGGVTGLVDVAYTLAQEKWRGFGNLVDDPIFVDKTYYHLQSHAGQYEGGYFKGGEWGVSRRNSPGIDAGDPASPWLGEPEPHGGRANLGAYGHTGVASMSAQGKVTISVD